MQLQTERKMTETSKMSRNVLWTSSVESQGKLG